MAEWTAAIIAGGKSSRMGTDKSFVTLAGKPLMAHVIARIATLDPAHMLIVTNKPDAYAQFGLPMVGDVLPDKGSLGGIYTALSASRTDYTLTVSCDTPFVSPGLLRLLLALIAAPDGPFDVIVPRADGYPEGLQAIYRKSCLAPIRAQLDADRLKVISFYPAVRVRYVDEPEYAALDPHKRSFFNVNTPDELEEARRMLTEE